jgi:hypothetical protein
MVWRLSAIRFRTSNNSFSWFGAIRTICIIGFPSKKHKFQRHYSRPDLTVTLYQVQARVRESQYDDDVYMVTIVKPEGIGDLIDEEGTLMERGKFSFD